MYIYLNVCEQMTDVTVTKQYLKTLSCMQTND